MSILLLLIGLKLNMPAIYWIIWGLSIISVAYQTIYKKGE